MKEKLSTLCNLCDGSGYIKSNTMEYDGPCPDLPHDTKGAQAMKDDMEIPAEEINKSKPQHAPWKQSKFGRMLDYEKYPEGSPSMVVKLPNGKEINALTIENAASIVRAVNCHEELLAALKAISNAYASDGNTQRQKEAFILVRKAIAKAMESK